MPDYSHGDAERILLDSFSGTAVAPIVVLLDDSVDEPGADPAGSLVVVVLLVHNVDQVMVAANTIVLLVVKAAYAEDGAAETAAVLKADTDVSHSSATLA